MTAQDEPSIDVPQTLAFHAKALSGVLPQGMKTLIVAFDEAVPGLPLMACNASRAATLAVLRQMIIDIEKAPAGNRQARRAEEAEARKQTKGPGVMESGWAHYGGAFIPPTAPVVQRVEMRKAFYAGASYVLQALRELGSGDPAEDKTLMDSVDAELAAFDALQTDLRKRR